MKKAHCYTDTVSPGGMEGYFLRDLQYISSIKKNLLFWNYANSQKAEKIALRKMKIANQSIGMLRIQVRLKLPANTEYGYDHQIGMEIMQDMNAARDNAVFSLLKASIATACGLSIQFIFNLDQLGDNLDIYVDCGTAIIAGIPLVKTVKYAYERYSLGKKLHKYIMQNIDIAVEELMSHEALSRVYSSIGISHLYSGKR